jgi:cell division protein FtsB
LVEIEQKANNDIIKELKAKYKGKVEVLRKKSAELKNANDVLSQENSSLKQNINGLTEKNQDLVEEMQSNLRFIRSEWEKKCEEVALDYQKTIVSDFR